MKRIHMIGGRKVIENFIETVSRYKFLLFVGEVLLIGSFLKVKVLAQVNNVITIPSPTNWANIGDILNVVLPLFFFVVGITLFGMILYGGFTWMTSQGEPEKLKKAQGTMISAIIGFIIIVASGLILSVANDFLGVKVNPFSYVVSNAYACATTDINCLLFGPSPLPYPSNIIHPGTTPTDTSNTISGIVAGVINLIISIIGLIALIYVIIGGYKYITSAGEAQKAEEARKSIIHALIGLVIVLLSWTIVHLVATIFGVTLCNVIPLTGGPSC